jgi:uncharacterized protein (DUF2147 family)
LRSPVVSGFAVLVSASLMGILPASSESDPSGIWLTQAGDARIQVSRCGAGICGRIVWLRDPIDSRTGQPHVDDKNPNPALKQRPIVGLSILIGMRPSGPAKWSGQIYNSDDGETYTAHVTVQNDATLDLRRRDLDEIRQQPAGSASDEEERTHQLIRGPPPRTDHPNAVFSAVAADA